MGTSSTFEWRDSPVTSTKSRVKHLLPNLCPKSERVSSRHHPVIPRHTTIPVLLFRLFANPSNICLDGSTIDQSPRLSLSAFSNHPVGSMMMSGQLTTRGFGATLPHSQQNVRPRSAAALDLDGPTVEMSVDASHQLIQSSLFPSCYCCLMPDTLPAPCPSSLSFLLFPIDRRLPAFLDKASSISRL